MQIYLFEKYSWLKGNLIKLSSPNAPFLQWDRVFIWTFGKDCLRAGVQLNAKTVSLCPQKLSLGKLMHENKISERARCSKIKANPTLPWQNPYSVGIQLGSFQGRWASGKFYKSSCHHQYLCVKRDTLGKTPGIQWNALTTNANVHLSSSFSLTRDGNTWERVSQNICWLLITWRNMHNQESEECSLKRKTENSLGEKGKAIFSVARRDLCSLSCCYFIHKMYAKEMLIKGQC